MHLNLSAEDSKMMTKIIMLIMMMMEQHNNTHNNNLYWMPYCSLWVILYPI